ncbi:MAG: 1,4-dihydroxy-2-naphthoate polyprenyltransferase [Clostridia bacterium]|nr:1,4-dihydroxy-2-naphthoate polyprenyltransferase [Clostridia bacterium]
MTAKWKKWWRITRPHTLTASFVPVFVGTALAYQEGSLNFYLLAAMLLASMLIQIATNLFNEYYDFKRGLDTEESVGIGGAIVREGMSPRLVLSLALFLYGVSVLLGVYICLKTTWWIAVIGAISMLVGYLYTGGPYPIAYTPFGEIFAGFFMGPVIILITYYIQTGLLTLKTFLVSIPIGVLIGAILMANNIRDLDKDKEKGRKTLAILLGKEKAIKFLAGMFIFSYLWVFFLVLADYLYFWSLLCCISIPKARQAVIKFKGKKLPIEMMPAMKLTSETNTGFGILLALGIMLSTHIG